MAHGQYPPPPSPVIREVFAGSHNGSSLCQICHCLLLPVNRVRLSSVLAEQAHEHAMVVVGEGQGTVSFLRVLSLNSRCTCPSVEQVLTKIMRNNSQSTLKAYLLPKYLFEVLVALCADMFWLTKEHYMGDDTVVELVRRNSPLPFLYKVLDLKTNQITQDETRVAKCWLRSFSSLQ